MLLNVLDYESATAALDAAQDGDRVYFPGFMPYTAPPGGWRIHHNIEVFGDGIGNVGTADGTTFYPGGNAADDHVFVLEPLINPSIELSNVHLHDFKITKRPTEPDKDGACGIYCKTDIGQKASAVRLERISVLNLRGTAFYFGGLNANNEAIVNLTFIDCNAAYCGRGMYFKWVFNAAHLRSYANRNDDNGCFAETSAIAFFHSSFENNNFAGVGTANLAFQQCSVSTVLACRFEHLANGPRIGVLFDHCGGAAFVGGCEFVASGPGVTAIKVGSGAGNYDSGPVTIMPNRCNEVDVIVDIDPDRAYDCVIMPQYSETTPVDFAGQMKLPNQRASVGAPHVNRGGGPLGGTNTASGLAVPAVVGGVASLQYLLDGMLVYDGDAAAMRLRRGSAWETLVTGAPLGKDQLKIASFSGTAGFNIGGANVGIGFDAELTTATVGGTPSWAVRVRQQTWNSGGGAGHFDAVVPPATAIDPATNTVLGIVLKNGLFSPGGGQVEFDMAYIANGSG